MLSLLCSVRDCRAPLAHEERRLICPRGHSFDIARSGYFNLLQPQDRRSRVPGDTKEAVAARRRFLDRGHAEPLLRATLAFLGQVGEGVSVLDAGCGEGYHLGTLEAASHCDGNGVDISVAAIDAAARRHPRCTWVVANADRMLPYPADAFDVVMSITARLNAPEFRRVLADDGRLLLAVPAPDDLVELREAVLGEGIERDRVQRTIDLFAPYFSLVKHERATHVAELDRAAIEDVMTSSYRGLRTRERERLQAIDAMRVTMSRDLLLFTPLPRRDPAPAEG